MALAIGLLTYRDTHHPVGDKLLVSGVLEDVPITAVPLDNYGCPDQGRQLWVSRSGPSAVGRGMPVLTRFEHHDDLSSVCFLVWRGGRLQSMRPPPVGDRRVIVRELGPMGM